MLKRVTPVFIYFLVVALAPQAALAHCFPTSGSGFWHVVSIASWVFGAIYLLRGGWLLLKDRKSRAAWVTSFGASGVLTAFPWIAGALATNFLDFSDAPVAFALFGIVCAIAGVEALFKLAKSRGRILLTTVAISFTFILAVVAYSYPQIQKQKELDRVSHLKCCERKVVNAYSPKENETIFLDGTNYGCNHEFCGYCSVPDCKVCQDSKEDLIKK